MSGDENYERREQTLVKHLILRRYLERFAIIVGFHWSSITYVDCFAGPWNVRSEQLKDSSFAIALEELGKARGTHSQKGKALELRCFFLEKDREAFGHLAEFARGVPDAEIGVLNGEFEDSVAEILRFIQRHRRTFPFIFIDPTGWTGFRLEVIAPLLRLNPGEVLINFMTSHIRRFLRHEGSRQGFIDLFGSDRVIRKVEGLSGVDLDDAIVSEYMDAVKNVGRFEYVLSAIVLHPEIERTHFHLIYGTRHPRGVEVFKEAERIAMKEMLQVRSDAQSRRERERTGQGDLWELFGSSPPAASQYFDELRHRYLGQGRQGVLDVLERQKRLPYDQAWAKALSHPLVWESDLREWIGEWQKNGLIAVEGLQGRERVPRRGHDHVLVGR